MHPAGVCVGAEPVFCRQLSQFWFVGFDPKTQWMCWTFSEPSGVFWSMEHGDRPQCLQSEGLSFVGGKVVGSAPTDCIWTSAWNCVWGPALSVTGATFPHPVCFCSQQPKSFVMTVTAASTGVGMQLSLRGEVCSRMSQDEKQDQKWHSVLAQGSFYVKCGEEAYPHPPSVYFVYVMLRM